MPYGDRTGPTGAGPGTGRKAGFCAGYQIPGYMNSNAGFGGRGGGVGMGRGGRRGHRHWFHATGQPGWQRGNGIMNSNATNPAPMTKEQEIEVLKNQAQSLETSLDSIKKRMDELSQDG